LATNYQYIFNNKNYKRIFLYISTVETKIKESTMTYTIDDVRCVDTVDAVHVFNAEFQNYKPSAETMKIYRRGRKLMSLGAVLVAAFDDEVYDSPVLDNGCGSVALRHRV
jgi:hypothetical protein